MDHKKQYDALIQSRRKKGIPEGYVEKHHIIPKVLVVEMIKII